MTSESPGEFKMPEKEKHVVTNASALQTRRASEPLGTKQATNVGHRQGSNSDQGIVNQNPRNHLSQISQKTTKREIK